MECGVSMLFWSDIERTADAAIQFAAAESHPVAHIRNLGGVGATSMFRRVTFGVAKASGVRPPKVMVALNSSVRIPVRWRGICKTLSGEEALT
jgi:hypothetical protein